MSRRDRQRELERVEDALERVKDKFAANHAEIEQLQASNDRKEQRTPKTDEWEWGLEQEMSRNAREIKRLRARQRQLQKRRKRLARSARKLARKLRNSVKPKVVDLGATLDFRPMTPQAKPTDSIGHYTAGPTDDDDDEALDLWRRVHAAHLAQGWSGIGYQLGLTRDGTIVKLRPLDCVGSHTLGHNTGQAGLSVHGTTGDAWTKPQLRALKVARRKFGLTGAKTVHNDWMATGCPGDFESGYKR